MEAYRFTAKQQAFIDHYVATKNGAKSAVAAGYKPTNAKQIATENLSKPYIKDEINRRLAELATETRVSGKKVIDELAAIALFRLDEVVQVNEISDELGRSKTIVSILDSDKWSDRAKSAIELVEQTDKGGIKIRAHSKNNALKQLGDHFGIFRDIDSIINGLLQYGHVTWLEDGSGFKFSYFDEES